MNCLSVIHPSANACSTVETALDLVDGRALAVVARDVVPRARSIVPAGASCSSGIDSSSGNYSSIGSNSRSNNGTRSSSNVNEIYGGDRDNSRKDCLHTVVHKLVQHLGSWHDLNPTLQLWCQEIHGQLAKDFVDQPEAAIALLCALLSLHNSSSASTCEPSSEYVPFKSPSSFFASLDGSEACLKDSAANPTGTTPTPVSTRNSVPAAMAAPTSSIHALAEYTASLPVVFEASVAAFSGNAAKTAQAASSSSSVTYAPGERWNASVAATTNTLTDDTSRVLALGVHPPQNESQSTCQRPLYSKHATVPSVGRTGSSGTLTGGRGANSRGKGRGEGRGKGMVGSCSVAANQAHYPTHNTVAHAPPPVRRPPQRPSPPPSPRRALDYPGIDVENQEPSVDHRAHNGNRILNKANVSRNIVSKKNVSTSNADTNGSAWTADVVSDAALHKEDDHASVERGLGLRMGTMWDPTYKPSTSTPSRERAASTILADKSVPTPSGRYSNGTAQAKPSPAAWDSSSSSSSNSSNVRRNVPAPQPPQSVSPRSRSAGSSRVPPLSRPKQQVPDSSSSSSSSSRRVSFAQNGSIPSNPSTPTQQLPLPSSNTTLHHSTPFHGNRPEAAAPTATTPSISISASTPAQRAAAAVTSAADSAQNNSSRRPQSNTGHRGSDGREATAGATAAVAAGSISAFVSREVNAARTERAAKRAARREQLQTFVDDHLRAVQTSVVAWMRSLGVRLPPNCLPSTGATSPYFHYDEEQSQLEQSQQQKQSHDQSNSRSNNHSNSADADWLASPLLNPLTNGVALAELCAVIAMRRPSADSKKDAVLVEPAPLLSSLQAGYQMHNTNNSSDGDCVGRHRDSAATPVSGRFLLRGTTLDVKTTARAVANAKRALAFLKGRREMSGSAHWHDPVALVDWLSRARAASQQREARSTSEDAKAHADEKFTPSDDETLRSTMLREQMGDLWGLFVDLKDCFAPLLDRRSCNPINAWPTCSSRPNSSSQNQSTRQRQHQYQHQQQQHTQPRQQSENGDSGSDDEYVGSDTSGTSSRRGERSRLTMTPADAEVVAEAKRLYRAGAISKAECDEVVAAANRRYRRPDSRIAATPATATSTNSTSEYQGDSSAHSAANNGSKNRRSAVGASSSGRRSHSEPSASYEDVKATPYPTSKSRSPSSIASRRASSNIGGRGTGGSGDLGKGGGSGGESSPTGLNVPEPPQTARTAIGSRGGLGGYQEWDTNRTASSRFCGRPSSTRSHHAGKISTVTTAKSTPGGAARQRISFESVKDDESILSSNDDDDDSADDDGVNNSHSASRSVYKTSHRSIEKDKNTAGAVATQSSVTSKRLPLAWTPASPSSRRAAAASAAAASARSAGSSNGMYSDTRALLNTAFPAANAVVSTPATTAKSLAVSQQPGTPTTPSRCAVSRSLSRSPSRSRSQGRSTVDSAAAVAASTAAEATRQAAEDAAANAAHQLSMGIGMSTNRNRANLARGVRGRNRHRGMSSSADSFISAWAPPPLGDPTWRRHRYHHHRSLSPKTGELSTSSASARAGISAYDAPPSDPQLWPPPATGPAQVAAAATKNASGSSSSGSSSSEGGGAAYALVFEVTSAQANAARSWLMGLGFAVPAPELNGSSSSGGNNVQSSSDKAGSGNMSGTGESGISGAAVGSPLLDPLRNGLLLGDLLEVLEPHAASHARLNQVLWRPPKTVAEAAENVTRCLWLLRLRKCPPLPTALLDDPSAMLAGSAPKATWSLLWHLMQAYPTVDELELNGAPTGVAYQSLSKVEAGSIQGGIQNGTSSSSGGNNKGVKDNNDNNKSNNPRGSTVTRPLVPRLPYTRALRHQLCTNLRSWLQKLQVLERLGLPSEPLTTPDTVPHSYWTGSSSSNRNGARGVSSGESCLAPLLDLEPVLRDGSLLCALAEVLAKNQEHVTSVDDEIEHSRWFLSPNNDNKSKGKSTNNVNDGPLLTALRGWDLRPVSAKAKRRNVHRAVEALKKWQFSASRPPMGRRHLGQGCEDAILAGDWSCYLGVLEDVHRAYDGCPPRPPLYCAPLAFDSSSSSSSSSNDDVGSTTCTSSVWPPGEMGRLALPYLGNGSGSGLEVSGGGQGRGNSASSTHFSAFLSHACQEMPANTAVVDAALDSLVACSGGETGSNPPRSSAVCISSSNCCAGAEMKVADSLDDATWTHRKADTVAAAPPSSSSSQQLPVTHLPYKSAPNYLNNYNISYNSTHNNSSSNHNEALDLVPRSATAPDNVNAHATWMSHWGSSVPQDRYWTASTGNNRHEVQMHQHHRHFDHRSPLNYTTANAALYATTTATAATAAAAIDTNTSNAPLDEEFKAKQDDTFLDLLPISDVNPEPSLNKSSSSTTEKPQSLSAHSPPNDASRRKVLDPVDLLPLPAVSDESAQGIAGATASRSGYKRHSTNNRSSMTTFTGENSGSNNCERPGNSTSNSDFIGSVSQFTPPHSLPWDELATLSKNGDNLTHTGSNNSSSSTRILRSSQNLIVEGDLAKKMLSDARRKARGAHVLSPVVLTPQRSHEATAAAICFNKHSKTPKGNDDDDDSMGSLSAEESINTHNSSGGPQNDNDDTKAAAAEATVVAGITGATTAITTAPTAITTSERAIEEVKGSNAQEEEEEEEDNVENEEGKGGAFDEPSPPWYLRAPGGGWADPDPWPWPWPRPPADSKLSNNNAALLAKVKAKKSNYQHHRPVPLRSPTNKATTKAPADAMS